MKRCVKCGRQYDDSNNFCPSCGVSLVEDNYYYCRNCGNIVSEEYEFCPVCGTKKSNAGGNNVNKKKKNNKKFKNIVIVLIVIALFVLAYVIYSKITAPRELLINNGADIELYVGDEVELSTYAEGLDPEELRSITWTSYDNNLIKIENDVLTASYDKNSFNSTVSDNGGSDEEECSYTSYIEGEFKKDIRTWKGSAKVVVSLKPVEFENGRLIKRPADPANESYIEIIGSNNYNTYFYLESTTKNSNDMSFIVKKGETATVDVPCDTYKMYMATGNTWYGNKILFGPSTDYSRASHDYEFKPGYYWTLELDVLGGNTTSDDISASEFPE